MLNGDEKYAQMRPHKYRKNTVYLTCSHTGCKAKLSLTIIPPIVTKQKKPKEYILSDEVTDDELLDTKNYGPFKHKCRQYLPSKDENGYFDVTRHENQCSENALYENSFLKFLKCVN